MRPSNLFAFDAVAARIRAGERLLLAGDPRLLARLPAGEWVGGSIPYFHDANGVRESRELIAVETLPDAATGMRIDVLGVGAIESIATRARPGEYIYVIMPGFSQVLRTYAARVHDIPGLLNQPVIGWVSGVHLSALDRERPLVFDGRSVKAHENAAVCAYVTLKPSAKPSVDIINIFTPGDGAALTFDADGFEQTHVLVDGVKTPIADVLGHSGLPLITEHMGAQFNVALSHYAQDGAAAFYAPVFAGITYKLAKPLDDYRGTLIAETTRRIPVGAKHVSVCVLHHAKAALDGHHLGSFDASMVFGEIAYILHNQTVTYLNV